MKLYAVLVLVHFVHQTTCRTKVSVSCLSHFGDHRFWDLLVVNEKDFFREPSLGDKYEMLLNIAFAYNCPDTTIRPTTCISFSQAITSVDLSHNKIRMWHWDITEIHNEWAIPYIDEGKMNASAINYSCLHEAFSSQMQSLDLSHNFLEVLPYHFSFLNNLMVLNVSHNRLKYVRPLDLNKLEIFILSHNHLSVIPEDFFQNLNNLKHLDLSSNQIFYFFPLSYPKNLEKLHLRKNKLAGLDTRKLQTIQKTLKELTLGANPWICDCMFEVLNFIHVNNIRKMLCEANYFEGGGSAVCIMKSHIPCDISYFHNDDTLKQFYSSMNDYYCY